MVTVSLVAAVMWLFSLILRWWRLKGGGVDGCEVMVVVDDMRERVGVCFFSRVFCF